MQLNKLTASQGVFYHILRFHFNSITPYIFKGMVIKNHVCCINLTVTINSQIDNMISNIVLTIYQQHIKSCLYIIINNGGQRRMYQIIVVQGIYKIRLRYIFIE